MNGNNQIVCEQAHLSKPWVKFGGGVGGGHQFSLHTAKIFSELSQVSRFEGYSHQRHDHTEGVSGTTYLDLLQVDVLASGASLVWPRAERALFGREAADRGRRSRAPYEIRRRTLLNVYYLPNRVLLEGAGGVGKRGNWGSFENFEVKRRYSQTNKQVNACASEKGQEESLPLGRVDGRPQTSIVLI